MPPVGGRDSARLPWGPGGPFQAGVHFVSLHWCPLGTEPEQQSSAMATWTQASAAHMGTSLWPSQRAVQDSGGWWLSFLRTLRWKRDLETSGSTQWLSISAGSCQREKTVGGVGRGVLPCPPDGRASVLCRRLMVDRKAMNTLKKRVILGVG